MSSDPTKHEHVQPDVPAHAQTAADALASQPAKGKYGFTEPLLPSGIGSGGGGGAEQSVTPAQLHCVKCGHIVAAGERARWSDNIVHAQCFECEQCHVPLVGIPHISAPPSAPPPPCAPTEESSGVGSGGKKGAGGQLVAALCVSCFNKRQRNAAEGGGGGSGTAKQSNPPAGLAPACVVPHAQPAPSAAGHTDPCLTIAPGAPFKHCLSCGEKSHAAAKDCAACAKPFTSVHSVAPTDLPLGVASGTAATPSASQTPSGGTPHTHPGGAAKCSKNVDDQTKAPHGVV